MICDECGGNGYVEIEVPRPQSFSRDIGEIDIEYENCPVCEGSGEMEDDQYE